SSIFLARATMPGMQKPHCNPPPRTKEREKISLSRSLTPSRVITVLPAARSASTTHETVARPSTITVQQPHCPSGLQPFFGDISPKLSLSRSSNVVSPSISAETGLPFKLNSITLPIRRLLFFAAESIENTVAKILFALLCRGICSALHRL